MPLIALLSVQCFNDSVPAEIRPLELAVERAAIAVDEIPIITLLIEIAVPISTAERALLAERRTRVDARCHTIGIGATDLLSEVTRAC